MHSKAFEKKNIQTSQTVQILRTFLLNVKKDVRNTDLESAWEINFMNILKNINYVYFEMLLFKCYTIKSKIFECFFFCFVTKTFYETLLLQRNLTLRETNFQEHFIFTQVFYYYYITTTGFNAFVSHYLIGYCKYISSKRSSYNKVF